MCSFFLTGACSVWRSHTLKLCSSSQVPSCPLLFRNLGDFHFHRAYNSGIPNQNGSLFRMRRRKFLFALLLFSGTFGFAWYLKQKKAERLRSLLEGCQRIPINEDLFEAKVSMYRYKGYVFPGQVVMSGVLKKLPNFQFCEEDVVVASFPKTGTTWVQEIIYMLLHNCKESNASYEVLETRFPYLEYPYPGITTIEKKTGSRFIKTHLPYQLLPQSFATSGAKLVYITRNPRDTAVSYFYFMRMMKMVGFRGTFDDYTKMFCSEKVPYQPFFSHVFSYWNMRDNPNILFLTYEDLHKDPFSLIRKIAEFLRVPVSEEEVRHVARCTSFEVMAENPSVNYEHWKDFDFAYKDRGSFMRKGKVGEWQKEFTAEQLKEFQQWEESSLANTDLKFIYTLK